MAPTRLRYARLIGPWMGHRTDRVLISICAGVGEELFFRGALQHWLGIPLTAVVFVALHGYLDPRDRRTMAYGLFMTVAMMGLGWMAQRFGLLAPMLAHAWIDVVLLERLHAWWRAEAPAE
jgi:membrane protease YdiL (CAAX protease family)